MNNNLVNYKGSFVKTFKLSAIVILILSIIVGVYLFISSASYELGFELLPIILIIILVGFILYLGFMAISKTLEQLLYIRKYLEEKHSE